MREDANKAGWHGLLRLFTWLAFYSMASQPSPQMAFSVLAGWRQGSLLGTIMSLFLTENILLHGQPASPELPVPLRAGPLHLELADGQLRHIRLGGVELVLRVYPAVRDAFWNTIPGVVSDAVVETRAAGFRVGYTSTHRNGDVDFTWRAEITGTEDGTVSFDFRGTAGAAFRKNRIGLCVLHPACWSGAACEVVHVSGDTAERKFPGLVDPAQPVKGLHDFHTLRYAGGEGVMFEMQCAGDVFEIEDQRNWTDASFKTYSTPQRIPMPAQLLAGQEIHQTITLRLSGPGVPATAPDLAPPGAVEITRGAAEASALPGLGVCAASHGTALTDEECSRLGLLQLGHLRVDVDPTAAEWDAVFSRTLTEATRIGCGVDAVLHLTEDAAVVNTGALTRLAALASAWSGEVRWLVLTKGRPATTAACLEAARRHLTGSIGGGTDADFFQLNNNRPPAALMDFVFVPLRPCAHQFDNATLAENLAGQRYVLESLRALYPTLPLHVSPVNLRTRAQKGPLHGPGEMPAQADVRQMSLLGAAWTIGCVKAVAASGAAGLTLFQTTGLRGLMDAPGTEHPVDFHCLPGGVYPMYHALKMLASTGGRAVSTVSTDPLRADALWLETLSGTPAVMLVNYSPLPVPVVLRDADGAPAFRSADTQLLHAGNAQAAMADATGFTWETATAADGQLTLPPFAVAHVTWQ